jgi:RimJ/RimL family protein N-acetyltransferase
VFTSQLQLETLFVLDHERRIVSTREPNATRGPLFALIRNRESCAWAVHRDVPGRLSRELVALARTEPTVTEFSDEPLHAATYRALLAATYRALLAATPESGPAFIFPVATVEAGEVVAITDLSQLTRHFRGWSSEELPDRFPIVGILENAHAVSVCFCARRSAVAAEAGLETAPDFRGRGFGAAVAATWARAILESGRLPIYSTSWTNAASLAVARKLGLRMCASDWSLYPKS